MDETLNKVFTKAGQVALADWAVGQWDRQAAELDDLVQDLWVWYSERPTTRKKMEGLAFNQQVETARKAAMQVLSAAVLNSNTFLGKDLYSSESVRTALRGEHNNPYLKAILPTALARLDKRNPGQREAIRVRYEDKEVPLRGTPAEALLKRAVKSLTEEVNVMYLTSNPEMPGTSAAVYPESRKRSGEHSDPTGNIAMALMDNPEYRESYLQETPLEHVIGGAGELPVYPVTETVNVRPDGGHAEILKDYPALVGPYTRLIRERLG